MDTTKKTTIITRVTPHDRWTDPLGSPSQDSNIFDRHESTRCCTVQLMMVPSSLSVASTIVLFDSMIHRSLARKELARKKKAINKPSCRRPTPDDDQQQQTREGNAVAKMGACMVEEEKEADGGWRMENGELISFLLARR
eukprot:scaffold293317_cov56-Attheya_sp.AAC.3